MPLDRIDVAILTALQNNARLTNKELSARTVNDLQVHVAVRDIHHLRSLIVERFASQPEVDHCETAVIYELHRTYQRPCYAGVEGVVNRSAAGPTSAKRRARS
jgi:DNA-binding Lrp family transcriptional regulator